MFQPVQSMNDLRQSLPHQHRDMRSISSFARAPFVRAASACTMFAFSLLATGAQAQDRVRSMPGYEQYQRVSAQMAGAFKSGALNVTWTDDGKGFEYTRDGKRYRYDLKARRATPAGDAAAAGGRGGRGGGPARGRQQSSALSPDSSRKAFYRDRNLYVSDTAGTNESPITTDGSEAKRIKYGTASWVYGEELRQTTAMWWNPDGTKIAYYRFDEMPVKDYYLGMDQTKVQGALDDRGVSQGRARQSRSSTCSCTTWPRSKTTRLDVRDGKPFTNDVVGHYVYNVRWSPDGNLLTFNRTNRRQNVMEFTACDPTAGSCRVVVREEWPASWTENHPTMQYLSDGKRFIWSSERTGFRNYYLYDMSGALITPLTQHTFEVASVVRVDEKAGTLWYTARDGDNHMKMQLHRVGLDGRNDRRLTDPAFNHSVNVSPDGKWFVDIAQTHDQAPVTRLFDATGKLVSELATSDLSKFECARPQAGRAVHLHVGRRRHRSARHAALQAVELRSGEALPGAGRVYGGPDDQRGARVVHDAQRAHRVRLPGVSRSTRAAPPVGASASSTRSTRSWAAWRSTTWPPVVTARQARPYVDGTRVGIFGTSYGGYASALALLRHPDAFAAASASSPVTSWYHYDTIYTERYMWTPQGNAAGYAKGDAMQYAKDLDGRLMLYYGTADKASASTPCS